MAKDESQKKPVIIPFQEVYSLLCPKCQLALRKLLGEKITEQIVNG